MTCRPIEVWPAGRYKCLRCRAPTSERIAVGKSLERASPKVSWRSRNGQTWRKMHLDILNVPQGYSFATSIQKVWTYLRICLTLSDSAALPEKSGLGHIKHAGCTTVSTAKVIYPPATWQQLVICFTAPKFQARQWLPCCSLEREHWNNMAMPRRYCNLNEMK